MKNYTKQLLTITCSAIMEQMKIDPSYIVHAEMDGVAGLLKPVVFHEGNAYCVLLGSDPQAGVFGCGDSVKGALEDWEDSLKTHLASANQGDEVAMYVKEVVANNPPAHVKEFMEQFRPSRKGKK